MFRLFRRRKKDKNKVEKQKLTIKSKINNTNSTINTNNIELISEKLESQKLFNISEPVTTFEEKFAHAPQIKNEIISEELPKELPQIEIPLSIKIIMENENSFNSFISPEIFSTTVSAPEKIDIDTTEISLTKVDLPPITLEEKIEGALFSIGRPIHITELIENLQVESSKIKRTLRKLSRQRKKTSAIIIEEISKDRWVLHLNPIYIEYFQRINPEKFLNEDERRVLTEICYRQPISIALIKKLVHGIGPVKINEICNHLEARGYIIAERKARSLVYTSTPKFAYDFGFDDESRRLKLQMLWRLKRLMGDFDVNEEEETDEETLDQESVETNDEIVDEEEEIEKQEN